MGYRTLAQYWDGGGPASGTDESTFDNRPNSCCTAPLYPNQTFERNNGFAYHYGIGVGVFGGIGLSTESDYSSYTDLTWQASGTKGWLVGNNAMPLPAQVDYVSNWCPTAYTNC